MVEKSSDPEYKVILKPEERIASKPGNKPKEEMTMDEYMCHKYVLNQMKEEEEALKAKANRQ